MQNKWAKITYEDGDSVSFKQGRLFEDGQFYKIVGDKVTTIVRKDKIIALVEQAREQGGEEYGRPAKKLCV